jgi:hypothetical protein
VCALVIAIMSLLLMGKRQRLFAGLLPVICQTMELVVRASPSRGRRRGHAYQFCDLISLIAFHALIDEWSKFI